MADELEEALSKTAKREAGQKAKRLREAEERVAQFAARSQSIQSRQKNFSPTTPQPRDQADHDRDTIIVDRDKIDANPLQPREDFDEKELQELGKSLREDGQVQAILVRPHPTRMGRFQLVAGERRWRAAAPQYGDVERLRATVRELTDEQVLRIGLIENVKRKDLTAMEIARGLERLKSFTQVNDSELARDVGFSKGRVSQLLSLLTLSPKVQDRFKKLKLNEKHGRALLSLADDEKAQSQLLRSIEKGEMSGNEALRVADSLKPPTSGPSTWTTSTPADNSESVSRETPASTSTATPATSGVGMSTSGGDTSAASRPGAEVSAGTDTSGANISRETKAVTPDTEPARADTLKYLHNAAQAAERAQMPDVTAKVRAIIDEFF